MHCPNCNQIITESSLVKRNRGIHHGFVLSNTQLFCPVCDVELTYSGKSLFLGAGGFAIFVICGLVNLVFELPHSTSIIVLALGGITFAVSTFYQSRFIKFVVVKRL